MRGLEVLSPESAIDAASSTLQRRLVLGLVAAVLLISLVAYFEDARSLCARCRASRARRTRSRAAISPSAFQSRDVTSLRASRTRSTRWLDQLQARLEELESVEAASATRSPLRRGARCDHHPEQLLRVIVETAVEATGAHGGMIVGADGTVIEVGSTDSGIAQLELRSDVTEQLRHALSLRAAFRQRRERHCGLARRPVGDGTRERAPARMVKDQAHVDGLTGLATGGRRRSAHRGALARGSLRREPLGRDDRPGQLQGGQRRPRASRRRHGPAAVRTPAGGSVRDVDTAARWGGEEFLLILRDGRRGADAARRAGPDALWRRRC